MHKIIVLILCLLPFSALADKGLTVLKWEENTVLNRVGKNSVIAVQGQINTLPNQAMTSFGISFDKRQKIKMSNVFADGKPADFSFSDNSLRVKFAKPKENNETFILNFAYEESYDKPNEFLIQEMIDIPSFAAGANAKVIVNFPDYLESATLNPHLIKGVGNFTYSNKVPQSGVHEVIKLTETQSVWNVIITTSVSADKPFSKTKITLPLYFQNGGQKVENFFINSNIPIAQRNFVQGKNILSFDTQEKEINIKNKAQIFTGKNNRTQITRNPNNYLKLTQIESLLLTPILEQIKRDPKYNDFPLYAKIGKFVHNFIKYDVNYVGRLPKVERILQEPIGVCTEYATLYNALARVAGIPAMIIDGAACGEYDKCQGHAWNMIFYNNQWIPVDATWDLMSGIVSSSHVYFIDSDAKDELIEYLDDKKTISSKMDFEMKKAF